MTKYVRNEEGAVQSVTDEHFALRLHQNSNAGRSFILPGWVEVDEKTARKENPQLFGVPDPQVTYTDDELIKQVSRKKLLAELYADAPTV